jgi:hypothetical protein
MICIDPTNSKYFQIFARAVKAQMGGEISTDYSRKGVHWILNYVSFKNGTHLLIKTSYSVIQTEQPQVHTRGYKDFLSKATKVWDWSKDLFVGYSEAYRLAYEEAKPIDVLFYGEANVRRINILQSIEARGIKVTTSSNLYGRELWRYVASAKIVLSIHYYENTCNDWPRIAPLISNHAFVICEEADAGFNRYSHILPIYKKEDIAGAVEEYLNNPAKRLLMADVAFDFIKQNPMVFK